MTWTAPEVTRPAKIVTGPERPMLENWLDWHRQTLLSKCAGLTAGQVRTASVEPSNLTLLGLVRHMAEVERGWFRHGVAGQPVTDIWCTQERPDADFDDVAAADPRADFATFEAELAAVRAAVADLPLEHTFRNKGGKEFSLRWVYLHMIEEYARHNGHADLIRERIDGVTGD
ncbi:MAG TPA: DinB family protein [Catenuloplanes sp.]